MTNYPTSLDSLVNPSSSDTTTAVDHAAQHANVNDAVEALEAKLGIGSSVAASGKLLRGTGVGESAWDKDAPTGTIVGTSDSQTLTNKTLTSPTINTAIINNPTLNTDTIAEYTSNAGVTIDGVLIKDNKINGSYITDDTITDSILDYPRWWQELGRNTLTVAGDTLSVTSLPARKYLYILLAVQGTGGTISVGIRFNNDSSANYSYRLSANGGADSTGVSDNSALITGATTYANFIFNANIINIAAQEKLMVGWRHNPGTAGAGNLPDRTEHLSKWANTAAQINRIDAVNLGTGDYAIGSELIVLGHN